MTRKDPSALPRARRPLRGAAGSLLISIALLVVGGGLFSAVPAWAGAARVAIPEDSVVLSNERTITKWGYTASAAYARLSPHPRGVAVTRLRHFTEDGFPEVYLVLRRYRDPRGRTWLLVRLPMRPNHRKGWVPEPALTELSLVRTRLVLDRRRLRATLYRRGRRIWSAPIGVGARATPTPGGRFWIRERIRVPFGGGLYGPWAFGTSAYSSLSDWPGGGVVGIHGTNQPWLIPGRPSHGCIRVRNPAIRRLARLMPIGTPLHIV